MQARHLAHDLAHAVQIDLGAPAKLLRPLHRRTHVEPVPIQIDAIGFSQSLLLIWYKMV